MSPICGYCDEEAQGYATINGVRYCHASGHQDCYQLAQNERSWGSEGTPRNAGDVPTAPILRRIQEITSEHRLWAHNDELLDAMPPGTTMTVAMAKMRRIYRAGLARGDADKHMRGDWELTDKGRAYLAGEDA